MTIVQQTLENLSLGDSQQAGRLTLVPVLAEPDTAAEYLLLDAAQSDGLATVTEVSEGGSVPELLLDNAAGQPVFLLDGEELLGARQNRIVNLSLLVPAATRQTIPVSCVEAGRWSYRSDAFRSSDRTVFASARARKSQDVTVSLAETGSRHTDQCGVWDDVADVLADFSVESETGAVADLYDERADTLSEVLQGFVVEPGTFASPDDSELSGRRATGRARRVRY